MKEHVFRLVPAQYVHVFKVPSHLKQHEMGTQNYQHLFYFIEYPSTKFTIFIVYWDDFYFKSIYRSFEKMRAYFLSLVTGP